MPVTRRIARPMLAAMFISGGLDSLLNPEPKAPKAATVGPSFARSLGLPEDPALLVRFNGATHLVAGTMLSVGRLPRLSAAALAATLVPTTLAGHRFWEESDPKARAAQRIHFLKNLAMLGGLILAAADTEGRPSVGWRARKAAERLRSTAK
jgi:putative oxidoreductase